MRVSLQVIKDAFLLQVVVDGIVDLVNALAGEPIEPFYERPELIQWGQGRKAKLLAQREVLFTCTRCGVNYPGSFVFGDLVPRDNPMLNTLLRWQLITRP